MIPAPAKSRPADRGQGEAGQPAPDLEAAEVLAVANMNFLADLHEKAGFPEPEPGPAYRPADYGTMTGKLICRNCDRPIREHRVGEWH